MLRENSKSILMFLDIEMDKDWKHCFMKINVDCAYINKAVGIFFIHIASNVKHDICTCKNTVWIIPVFSGNQAGSKIWTYILMSE